MERREMGNEAEQLAVEWLEREGYLIRGRNFFCPWGELDIIAEKEQVLCFVEVRMRSSAAWGDPSHTVMSAKQHRVVKTALHFLQKHRLAERMIRFDVISVVGRGRGAHLEHIPNAFDAGR